MGAKCAFFLSEQDLNALQLAAERVLEECGFSLCDSHLLKLFSNAGAKVDAASGRVRVPAVLLRELLSRAPRRYGIRGIDGTQFTVGGNTPGVFAITHDPWIVDYATLEPRRPGLADVARHTALAQLTDGVVCASCMDFPVVECDDASSPFRALEVHLLNHTKHYAVLAASPERFALWTQLLDVLEDAAVPSVGCLATSGIPVVSPLTLTAPNCTLLVESIARGCAIMPTICPMAGTTSPYTLAGTLLLGHCENLYLAALTQLVRPGHPFLYTLGPSVSDLRSGHDRYYTLDKALWKVAAVQLAHASGLPAGAEMGGSMRPRYDMQTGAEGMMFMAAAVASGADLLCGLGSFFNGIGMSAEMMVVQEEWLDAARFLARGIRVDADRLAVESLLEGGPGANFLTDITTLRHARDDEFHQSEMWDCAAGPEHSRSLLERAHDRVKLLTKEYASPVPGAAQEALRRYFADLYGKFEAASGAGNAGPVVA